MLQILFLGSFQHYSVQVLDRLAKKFTIVGVVTTPPRPAGRDLALKSTEVAIYSKNHNLPLFEPESLDTIPSFSRPDFLVVAGFGKLIPNPWLDFPKIMAVNLHQSLLPKYPGRFPAEWAILKGETETGDTLIKMSPEFDKGEILSQQVLPIDPDDTRETLYTRLYNLGGDLLISTLPRIASGQITPHPQPPGKHFYARQITREDGFIPWEDISVHLEHLESERAQRDPAVRGSSSTRDSKCEEISRKFRAFAGWPGVWTTTPAGTRLKLMALQPQILVQEEGKKIKPWLH